MKIQVGHKATAFVIHNMRLKHLRHGSEGSAALYLGTQASTLDAMVSVGIIRSRELSLNFSSFIPR